MKRCIVWVLILTLLLSACSQKTPASEQSSGNTQTDGSISLADPLDRWTGTFIRGGDAQSSSEIFCSKDLTQEGYLEMTLSTPALSCVINVKPEGDQFTYETFDEVVLHFIVSEQGITVETDVQAEEIGYESVVGFYALQS